MTGRYQSEGDFLEDREDLRDEGRAIGIPCKQADL
jgi:hypothetical protein